jgi:Putative metallopeptidase
MHHTSHTPGGLRRKFAAVALLGALALGAGPACAQELRTPYSQRIETGSDTRPDRGARQTRQELAEFVIGNMLFVLLHEMAHVHVAEMGLPVLGREEDAADVFSHDVLIQAAKGWFLSAERDERQGQRLAFYDEHGLDRQRAYQIVCLMVGSDPEKFGDLADLVKMPDDRQETCQGDYSNATYSWDLVLKPHRRTADQPKTVITTVYGEDKSGLDVNARAFRSLRLLETIAERAAEEFVWRKPFALELQSCGKPGAHWDLMSHRLIVCYEMAEEFVQLYREQTLEPKPVAAVANELIARNIKTPARAEDAKIAPGLAMESSAKSASARGFEHLAEAMTTRTIEFVASPTGTARTEPALAIREAHN